MLFSKYFVTPIWLAIKLYNIKRNNLKARQKDFHLTKNNYLKHVFREMYPPRKLFSLKKKVYFLCAKLLGIVIQKKAQIYQRFNNCDWRLGIQHNTYDTYNIIDSLHILMNGSKRILDFFFLQIFEVLNLR